MPPSTNRLYATVNGRRVKTRDAREYAELIGQRVWLWKRLHGEPPRPPYRLLIVLCPPTRHRIDVSNSIKCLEDSLFAGIGGNDRTVVEVIARLGDRDPLNPRAEVTLEHVIEPAPAVARVAGAGGEIG
jgi:Holliday junction resolvase RusA-like endonuclease